MILPYVDMVFSIISESDVDKLGDVTSFLSSSLTFTGTIDVAEFEVVGLTAIFMLKISRRLRKNRSIFGILVGTNAEILPAKEQRRLEQLSSATVLIVRTKTQSEGRQGQFVPYIQHGSHANACAEILYYQIYAYHMTHPLTRLKRMLLSSSFSSTSVISHIIAVGRLVNPFA